MARSFVKASSEYLKASGSPDLMPGTLSCWYKTADATPATDHYLVCFGDASVTVKYCGLYLNDGGESSVIYRNTSYYFARSTSLATNGVWHHYAAVLNSPTSVSAFLDGGNKGTNTGSSGTPTEMTVQDIYLGVETRSTPSLFADGDLCLVAYYGAALSDADIANLYNGGIPLDPRMVRPDELVAYYPLLDDDGDVDWWSQFDLAVGGGSPTYAAGPPLLMPSGITTVVVPGAAPPAGGQPTQKRWVNVPHGSVGNRFAQIGSGA